MPKQGLSWFLAVVVSVSTASCDGRSPAVGATSDADVVTPVTSSTAASLSVMYEHFYGAQVSANGNTVVLRSTSVPDHPSPYFGAHDPRYEAPQSGMTVNPNRIETQSLELRVPATPELAAASDTNMGPIGIAVNGVALFNQYAAGRMPLDREIQTFDRYHGHPTPSNLYHYHMEPLFLTAQDSSRLVGVLLDGFPLYGTRDAGGGRPGDLDACNGHVAPTAEFPTGIYHYHVTTTSPYIAGCYRGRPGTQGQEHGLRRAWAQDGTLYLNYEARNGRRYGYVNARPCLPVAEERL